jgi:hypothetical protein
MWSGTQLQDAHTVLLRAACATPQRSRYAHVFEIDGGAHTVPSVAGKLQDQRVVERAIDPVRAGGGRRELAEPHDRLTCSLPDRMWKVDRSIRAGRVPRLPVTGSFAAFHRREALQRH